MTAEPAPARRAAFARGVEAEAAAEKLYASQGFELLARRVRTPRGEIDLVMRRAGLVVFVEVKARVRLDAAAEAILPRQRRRIAAAAEIFLADHPELARLDMRLDAVLVGAAGGLRHLPGAFEAE